MVNTSITMSANETASRRQFEFNLEALRGFAALTVVIFHTLVSPTSLDPIYTPSDVWKRILPGHASVLLFFILSGYVIGLTNVRPLSFQTIGPYIRKRLVRLYPIYAISLLFTILINFHQYSGTTILGHFLFLQNAIVPVFKGNVPLWSLNSEVVYYLAFIPISLLRLNPTRVALITVLAGLVFRTMLFSPILSSYCFGFAFWLSGLWLAKSNRFPRQYASPRLLAGLLVIFLGYEYLNPFVSLVTIIDTKLHINYPRFFLGISLGDTFLLPFYLLLFLRFTNYTVKGFPYIIVALTSSSLFYYFHIVIKFGLYSPETFCFLFPFAFVVTGLIVLALSYLKPQPTSSISMPNVFLKLGAISYGVYVIHFPVSMMLSHVNICSGTGLTFLIRLNIDIVLVLAAGYVFELKVQPWFKTRFTPKAELYTKTT